MIKSYIKSFSSFFIPESYTPIDSDNNISEMFSFIENECTDFLNTENPTKLYRGLSNSFKDKIYIADSTDYERKSPEFSCHNFIMDNNEEWKEYPKRSKSIICTNNKVITTSYGKPYYIIPANITKKIAVAPEPDVWESFDDSFGEPFDTSEFWQSFCIVLWKGLKQKAGERTKILDYNSLLDACELYDNNKTSILNFYNKGTGSLDMDKALKLLLQEFLANDNTKTMYELLSEIFTPDKFKLYNNYNDFCSRVRNSKYSTGHEIWYEGRALMISLSDKIFERYIDDNTEVKSGQQIFDFIKNYYGNE